MQDRIDTKVYIISAFNDRLCALFTEPRYF